MAKRETPSFEKSPAALVERFGAVMDRYPEAQRKKMFGYPAAFVGGNLTAGLHQENVMVRLPEAEREERLADGWSRFSPMPGRPMREYVAMPPEVAGDVTAMRHWIERAAVYVRTLPPKAPKKPKRA